MAPQAPRAVLRCSVVIVGGGPHALACLAALVGGDGKSPVRGTVAVIDPGSHFLDAWYGRFRALEIDRLRSPAYVHPSAFEPTALVEFAIREGRTAELEAAPVAVQWMPTTDHRPEHADSSGASLLKALPSSALFRDFCASLEAELPHKWLRGTATRVARAGGGGGGGGSSFRVQYSAAGEPHELREVEAAALILATGPVGAWSIPPPFAPLLSAASSACGRVLHSEQLLTQGRGTLREEVARRSGGDGGPASVLVIGGGISAAQAALTASRAGHRVVLRSRRPLQSRPFDIAVGWLDVRHADRLRFEYLCLPPTRRLQAIRDATAGGSVPAPHLEDAAQGPWGPSGSLQAASPQAPYLEELQRLAASPGSSLRIEVTA
uniref:FAD-dependent oxidoreductase 2 FAD-binding domain-containing protein n=1 Tax=Emiliania huxleyi TaxID=2903 RepID=A0A6V2N815_EMIHU